MLVFLMETKVENYVLDRIGRKIQYSNLFVVPRHNIGGGLALFWKIDSNVDVQSFSDRHIDAIIDHGVDDTWRFTGFYGDLDTASRENSWSLLRTLHNRFNLPWLCIGDFNEILLADKKQGWLDRLERQMQGFREALDYCRLRDLGFNRYPFTWCNKRPYWKPFTWILRFLSSQIHHLEAFHSDHKPILLSTYSKFKCFYKKGRPFRFESMWIKYNSCEGIIKDSWGTGPTSPLVWDFSSKISTCQENLKLWNRSTFGHVCNTLAKKLRELQNAEESDCYRTNLGRIYVLRDEIQKLKTREELMWKQRSRNMWLKEGDRNTRYFCCRANQRNRHNLILGLEDETGNWVEVEGQMGRVVQDYFESMFTSSNPSGFDEILEGMQPATFDASPLRLDCDFQAEEVHTALKQMAPLTAPSLDGMSPIFYKTYWNIVGEDVTAVVLNV